MSTFTHVYPHTLERLDGTAVEYPETLKYPNSVQEWAKTELKTKTDPEVYIYRWKHQSGEVVIKFYSEACWGIPTFAIEMFEEMCKEHDWTYEYSDDHRVWKRGREAEGRLKAKYTMLKNTEYKASIEAIWNTYAQNV